MNYRKFELLLTSLGFGVIFATIIASFYQQGDHVEILGQALFGPVLFAALHYGRRAGFVAAMLASIVFIIAKSYGQTQISFAPQIILARTAIFGLVGIVGGEIATRMKYVLLKFEDSALIDRLTNLYSRTFTIKVLERNIQNYQRHFRSFSVAFIEVRHWKFDVFAWPLKKRMILHATAAIRENVRIIDEVGHWGDGKFCIVMPDTVLMDAKIALSRICNLVLKQLNADNPFKDKGINVESNLLTFPGDREKISQLVTADLNIQGILEKNYLTNDLEKLA